MPLEATPLAVATPGNLRVVFVPGLASNPLSVATLTAATTKDVTYSFTEDGWKPDVNENEISDGRAAQLQILSLPGNFSEKLETQYVYGDAGDVAKPALATGTVGYFVERVATPNATAWAAGQKVNVYTVKTGKQRPDAPAANSRFTMSQSQYLIAPTQRDAVLAA